jgi:hypothetical protein
MRVPTLCQFERAGPSTCISGQDREMTDELDDVLGGPIDRDRLTEINEIWLPACLIGLPQSARECLGYREREPGRLQLRVPMLHNEGVCDVVLDEHSSYVGVRVVVCRRDDDDDQRHWYPGFAEERIHAYLDAPLADRTVIDFETGKRVPFYVPTWLNDHRTKAPGFYTERHEAIAGAELLPHSEDDSPLVVRNAMARSRTIGW